MSLQVPPEIVKQRMRKQQQDNQLYSAAFQIFLQFIHNEGYVTDIGKIAKEAIHYAKEFDIAVKEDMNG